MQDRTQFLNPLVPTLDALDAVVNLRNGYAVIEPAVRLRTRDLAPLLITNPPDPGDPTSMASYVTSAKLTLNAADDVPGTADLHIQEWSGLRDYNSLENLAQVYATYYDDRDRVLLDIPMGCYSFAFPKRTLSDASTTWELTKSGTGFTRPPAAGRPGEAYNEWDITLHSRLERVRRLLFNNAYSAAPGYNPLDIVRAVLMMDTLPPRLQGRAPAAPGSYPDPANPALTPAGCESGGANFRAQDLEFQYGSFTLPSSIQYKGEDNQLADLNATLRSINYWKLFERPTGIIAARQIFPPDVASYVPPLAWVYTNEDVRDNVLQEPVLVTPPDVGGIYNRVSVRCEDPTRDPFIVTSYNMSERSFVSVPSYGAIIDKQPAVRDDKLISIEMALARAAVELEFGAMGQETVEFVVWLNPFIELHDAIGLYIWSPDGLTLEIDSTANPFVITHLEHDFDAMQTKITAGRWVPL